VDRGESGCERVNRKEMRSGVESEERVKRERREREEPKGQAAAPRQSIGLFIYQSTMVLIVPARKPEYRRDRQLELGAVREVLSRTKHAYRTHTPLCSPTRCNPMGQSPSPTPALGDDYLTLVYRPFQTKHLVIAR
jgi:hypothetical protein